MDEHGEDPVGHAGQKVLQYTSLATMAAEALVQARQHRAEASTAQLRRSAGAARAARTAQLLAAQPLWQSMLDPRRRARAGIAETLSAWQVALTWADKQPDAAVACDRARERLRELRPDVLDRIQALVQAGTDAGEAVGLAAASVRPDLASEPDQKAPSRAASGGVGENPDPLAPHGPSESSTHGAAASRYQRTAAQVARDGFPEPLTGEILAAGRARPKAPATAAPAAVRAVGLATAARASQSR